MQVVDGRSTEIVVIDPQPGVRVYVEVVVCALVGRWELRGKDGDAVVPLDQGEHWRGVIRADSERAVRIVPIGPPPEGASVVYGARPFAVN